MKKYLLLSPDSSKFVKCFVVFISLAFTFLLPLASQAQVTLVRWDFPNNPDNATADAGIAANTSQTISAQKSSGNTPTVNFNNGGATTNCATATGWDAGNNAKWWELSFSTAGYSTIKLSSKQRSSNTGPKNWKVQYKLGAAGTWTDASITITVADNFTTGVVSAVTLPSSTDNQSSVYLRWIMTSNTSVNNSTVAAGGTSRIDDIIVTGVAAATLCNPTAQALPYTQNFGTAAFTAFPAGFCGWGGLDGGSYSTQAQAEASVPDADAALTSQSSAFGSEPSGALYGFATSSNGRLCIATSNNADDGLNQPVCAINTGAGVTSVTIAYDLEVLYSGSRTSGIVLQYRAGTTGTWTTVAGSDITYSSPALNSITGNAYTITGLIASTDYQFRWASWRNHGSGSSNTSIGLDNVVITAGKPTLTEVFLPQYIQGKAGTNNERTPYAFRATLSNLLPSATYRYYNQVVLTSDPATLNGVGNCIFPAAGGYTSTTGPSLSTTGNYSTFTTNASGSYTGWFVTEPTGDGKFTAGNQLRMRIMLNTSLNNSVTEDYRLSTTNTATALTYSTSSGAGNGSGLRGNSSATARNFVLLYDNTSASGRPLAGTFVESDGTANTTANNYAGFYNTSVNGTAGAWGAIIPNSNANGVRRIEQRALSDGSLVGCANTSNGVWPTGSVNTVNPTAGITALAISATDAPLSSCPASVAISASHPAAGNVTVGSTGNSLYSIRMDVTDGNATLSSVAFTTAGTYVPGDVVNFKLWYGTSSSIGSASQIGSTLTSSISSGSTITFSSLSQLINAGTTGYLFVTADISSTATDGNTVSIGATTFSGINLGAVAKTGTDPVAAGNTKTIVAPAVTINSLSVPSGNINQGTSNNVIYSLSISSSGAATGFTGLTLPATVTSAADFSANGFKLWYNTANSLSGATQLGAGINISAGNIVFSGLSQNIANGGTGYFFITADVVANATIGNAITGNALAVANVTFNTTVNRSGTTSAAGTQTIISLPYVLFDNFDRADNVVVGVPSSGGALSWQETETGTSCSPANAIVRVESNMLELSNCNLGSTASCGLTTNKNISFDVSAKYGTTFSNATSALEWYFNMKQSRTDPSGLSPASNVYGVAFVIGANEADISSSTVDGYAVVLGESGSSDVVRLVHFTNGISNYTTVASSAFPGTSGTKSNYMSVKVTFNPCLPTDNWSLLVRDDGSSAFANPTTISGTPTTGTNSTYTSAPLNYIGALWKHSSSCEEIARFDNIHIPSGNSSINITAQPQPVAVCSGGSATFTVTAVSTSGLNYQWRKDGVNIPSANAASYTINPVSATDAASYDVIVSTACGTADTSTAAALTLNASPSISIQPADVSVCPDEPATFSVTAAGLGIGYQWRKGGVDILGATSSSYTISNVSAADAGNYDIVVTGTCGSITSSPAAVLTVKPAAPDVTGATASALFGGADFSWINPADCFDEIMVVINTTAGVNFSPMGDGTSYTANNYYASVNQVVYKGTGTAMNVAGLTNGATYYAEVFTRHGTTWSSGVEVSVVPSAAINSADIIYTYVNADGDGFEFMTLHRMDMSALNFTDNGICSDNRFRKNETDAITTGVANWPDIPAGTLVRIAMDNTGTNDNDGYDGNLWSKNNTGGINASGEQVIAYASTANGAAGCGGSGSNTYVSGINWGNAGWTSGAAGTDDSKAPGTSTDFHAGINDVRYYNSGVTGPATTIASTSNVRDITKWTGTNTGSSFDGSDLTLKNILFNQSDYVSGALSFSSLTTTGFTVDWSNVVFNNIISDTRYLVVVHTAAPGTPVDRYTCYNTVDGNYTTASTVVTSVTGQTALNFCGTATTGNGKVVYLGYNRSVAITGLAGGVDYTVNVYAVNGNGYTANIGTEAGGNQTTLVCNAPTAEATALNFTTTNTNFTFNWSNGNGASRLILVKEGSAPTGVPANNTTYSVSADFVAAPALGDAKLVYNGSGNSVTVTNLTPGKQYFVQVYEYNCSAGSEKYYTTPGSGNTYVNPDAVVLTELCTTNSEYELSWTYGNGDYDGVVILARSGTNAPSDPAADASSYTGDNTDITLATGYAPSGQSKLVYKGTGNSAVITGLSTGQNYVFKAYTYKNASATKWSAGTQQSETIALPNVSGATASPDNQQVNVGWFNPGCFDEILVVANAGAVSFTPSGNGSSYTANPTLSGANQVVYKDTGVGITVTGLTNGVNYCFKIFVRWGTDWSTGVEVCTTPTTVTSFEKGDLAIVAVNTQIANGADEICFVTLKEILPGTSFYMTDNGYERENSTRWGTTEGVMRFTRKITSVTIPAGTVICLNGPNVSAPYYDVFVCGANDNADWQIDPNVLGSGISQFDLNSTDQVWIAQGGAWGNAGTHNATYTGKMLYGWTGIDWKADLGTVAPAWTTSGSTMYPKMDCFTTNAQSVSNNSKVKYTGPTSAATRFQWISRINSPANWTGYNNNTNYNSTASAYDYRNQCVTWTLNTQTETAGVWRGTADDEWFNCSNWETREVPDSTTNVLFPSSGVTNNCNIQTGEEAICNNLTLLGAELNAEGSNTKRVVVKGNLAVSGGAILDFSDNDNNTADGILTVYGDWNNAVETDFKHGNSTVQLAGNNQQVSCGTGTEVFYNLDITGGGVKTLSDDISIVNQLNLTNGLINTGTNEVEVANSGTNAIVNHSGVSFVEGNLRRAVNATGVYDLPVGAIISSVPQYELATIALNSSSGISNLLAYFNPSLPAVMPDPLVCSLNGTQVTDMLNAGYWTITPNAVTSANYDVTLNLTGYTNTIPASDFGVIKRHDGDVWRGTDATGGYLGMQGYHNSASQAVNGASAVAVRTGVQQFSDFGVGGNGGGSLPVILTSFHASAEDMRTVKLTWETLLEIDNNYFEVERSADGVNFYTVAQVKGAGNSTVAHYYETFDREALYGVSYYRLKQVDHDGDFAYSNLESVNITNDLSSGLKIYPTLSAGLITIESTEVLPVLEIRNLLGQKVAAIIMESVKQTVDVSQLPAGMYLVNGVKFVKQ